MISLINQAIIGNELALAWSDGVEDYIALEVFRRACPCAMCQGEPDAFGRVSRPKSSYTDTSFTVNQIEQIGGYALKPYWADGHQTGIFSYDYLRKIGQALREQS